MRAAKIFADELQATRAVDTTARVLIDLFGSLALTGKGHGTDRAVLLGLEGERPETIDPSTVDGRLAAIRNGKTLTLAGAKQVDFEEGRDLIFHARERLPEHPNGMRFTAFDANGRTQLSREYYSIGGGFVVA